jgi:hypothetical protein
MIRGKVAVPAYAGGGASQREYRPIEVLKSPAFWVMI